MKMQQSLGRALGGRWSRLSSSHAARSGGRLAALRQRLEEEARTRTPAGFTTPQPTTPIASVATADLTDRFGRVHDYLRLSLTERCNLRCTYCMPADGVALSPETTLLTSDEVVAVAAMFVAAGVRKIRLTGGEPLVRPDVVDVIARLRALPGLESVGITTNGLRLERLLPDLVAAGLTHVNVSLDTLVEERFAQLTRRKGLARVRSALDAALASHGLAVKLNCVVMRGTNDDELASFVALTRNSRLAVRFIEWMPFDRNAWNDTQFLSFQEMLALLRAQNVELRRTPTADDANDTTKWFQADGHAGQVGFITSMSEHFCGSCNRLRMTADGKLKACLFGQTEVDLKPALRGAAGPSSDELQRLVRHAVQQKPFALGGHRDMYAIADSENRPMILIGG